MNENLNKDVNVRIAGKKNETYPDLENAAKKEIKLKTIEEVQPNVENKRDEKKSEEKQFSSPAKKEVTIEIIVTRRKEFVDEVAKLSETLKERPLPEGLEKYIGRNIILEPPQRGKPSGKQQIGGQGGFDRRKKHS